MRSGAFTITAGDETLKLSVAGDGEARIQPGDHVLRLVPLGPDTYRVSDGETSWTVVVAGTGDERQAFVHGEVFDLEVRSGDVRAPRTRAHAGLLTAPMPAKVTGILVRPGDAVARGDLLLTLEAMKMELPLRAPRDGTVVSIGCSVGDMVQPGVQLLELSS